MSDLKDTLTITVDCFIGEEEGREYERPYYVAHCDEIGLVVDGDTWDDLLEHIREALPVCLDGADAQTEYQLQPNPRVILMMDLAGSYALTDSLPTA